MEKLTFITDIVLLVITLFYLSIWDTKDSNKLTRRLNRFIKFTFLINLISLGYVLIGTNVSWITFLHFYLWSYAIGVFGVTFGYLNKKSNIFNIILKLINITIGFSAGIQLCLLITNNSIC